ncbi:bi-domain-containing oxidoreductase [candidate division WOR-3 bacterium]|nr:bi-domain-containing oxidoreductase [candidate division WOR-3 bacterium]
MKQVFIKKGKVLVEEVPSPLVEENTVLVEVAYSVISPGTELSGVERTGESLISKTLNNPKKVKKMFDFLKGNGVKKTIDIIKSKTGGILTPGYSCAGYVIQVGKNVSDIKNGDCVACGGAGRAFHAEIVSVPRNLVVKIPEGCDLKQAASVTIGSIAMQGLRRCNPQLGEFIAVVGLGLLGQITTQLLRINGCRTIGFDVKQERVKKAMELGMDKGFVVRRVNVQEEVKNFTEGHGVDATIITASSKSSEITQMALEITRKKGRVVVVGDVGMDIKREPFYRKELDFLISCSYGPGRYDENYEEKGINYPYPYVRWTENHNMKEYLNLIADKKVDFTSLVEGEYKVSQAPDAYKELQNKERKPLSILIDYEIDKKENRKLDMKINLKKRVPSRNNKIKIAVIGAGSFATGFHLPNLKKLSNLYSITAIVDVNGALARKVADKFDAEYCTTDYKKVLEDYAIGCIFITTRHNLHSQIVIDSLKAGKNVFVEKPLALNEKELDNVIKTYKKSDSVLMVGFNRRFSPAADMAFDIIGERKTPVVIVYRVNAGYIPLDHWVHTKEGGGRIIGEACHMLDFFRFFTKSEVESVDVSSISPKTDHISPFDNFSTTVKYLDGSMCSLIYTAVGSKDMSKEYIEIYSENKVLVIDDFKRLDIYGKNIRGWQGKQDKGHFKELIDLGLSLKEGRRIPIPFNEIVETTKLSFLIDKGIRSS